MFQQNDMPAKILEQNSKYFANFFYHIQTLIENPTEHLEWCFLRNFNRQLPLRKNCPYSELFWSLFSTIWTEYEEILRISLSSVQLRENKDQNNSEYGHFLRSVLL